MTRSNEAADVVRAFYEMMATGDTEAIDRMCSDDAGAIMIGTDPDEWWEGGAQIKSALRQQLEGGGLSVRAGDPRVVQTGDVAWFADRPVFVMPDGQEVACRLTGVLHREQGEWKLVHSHGSLGVANAQAFGQ
jgi:ketosteroid isomerase-like protein